ncbi:MAG: polysaccharide biosynthesis tyrosine autokinase [Armatimonadota bacterium]
MEFWRYYRIIRRRRWLIILGMVVCIGAVAFKNMTLQPEYTGRTTVMEPDQMSGGGIPLYPEQYLQTDMQLKLSNLANIATSQKVLQDSAETLGDLNLNFTADEILAHTNVQPVKDTNILAIEVTLPRPGDAKVAADVIAAEFKKVYGELNNASVRQSREFIEAQLTTTRAAMVAAQNAVKKYKEQNGIVQLDQQSSAAVDRLTRAKSDLNTIMAEHQATVARANKLQAELQKLPEWETINKQISRDPQWDSINTQLIALETRKAAMLSGESGEPRKLNKHPEVVDVQRQINELKAKSKTINERYVSGEGKAKSQMHQDTAMRWLQTNVDEMGLSAQMQALQTVISDIRGEFSELPVQQAKLAELEADVAATYNTYSLMRNKLDEAKIKEQQAKNEVALKTIDPAYVYPVDQKKGLKLMMALILGPLLGIGVAFLLHYTDNSIKTPSEAEKLLGLPILSAVPIARAHSLVRQKCPEIVDVSYQMLTSSLWVASQNREASALAMVSAEPDAGRSVIASNLATALAQEGARVILVDADMRQPTQHLIFGADNKVGLTNLLSGGASIEDVLIPTRVQGLLLVPSGPVPGNPVKFLRSSEMKDFSDQVKEIADFVIYDTPAGVAFPDPILVAANVGSAVIVHSAGRVPRGSEAELNERLASVGVHVLGAVLNRVKREDSSGYFHYHRSYSGVGIGRLPGSNKPAMS